MMRLKNCIAFYLAIITVLTSCKKNAATDTVTPVSDSLNVTVINGFGSGKYKVGDTVNIWSQAIDGNHVFDTWSGYNMLLSNSGEWHNSFIMPAQNVTVTASLKSITAFTLTYEKIKGKNILKNVYYYFPAAHKGMVWLLHGTGGNAQNLVTNFEWQQMIRDLVSDNFAVAVTESEESSIGDLDGNGKIRWNTFPADSINNVDYANIKALRDTFFNRGYTTVTKPIFSIGMSNGGSFSAALSAYYQFKAGVSYCASSSSAVFTTSQTAFQFCMAKYDDNAEVGPQGNADALTNSQTLTGRGICSKYFLHDRSPVYPERFARWSVISATTSAAIFNELKSNNWLGSKNFLLAASTNITAAVQASPADYPVLLALSGNEKTYVNNQIDAMYAAHQFYSDYDKTTIKYLNTQCQ